MVRIVFVIALTAGIVVSCAKDLTTNVHTIERADGLGEAPEWASLTKSSYEKDGHIYYVGYASMPGDVNKSSALNVSDEKAFSEPLRALVQEFLDQNQVGEELRGGMTAQRIISATRGYRPPMPGLGIIGRYWETVVIQVGDEVKTELRCFSLAKLPLSDFRSARDQYLAKLAGNSEVQQILKDVGAKQREALSH